MYTRKDSIFAVVMLICGFLYCNLIFVTNSGFGVTLFTVIFCTVTVVYLTQSGFRQTRGSLAYLGIIALAAVNFSLNDNNIIKRFLIIFLSVSAVYWICVSTGRRLEHRISIYLFAEFFSSIYLLCHSGILPAASVESDICYLKTERKRIAERNHRDLLYAAGTDSGRHAIDRCRRCL